MESPRERHVIQLFTVSLNFFFFFCILVKNSKEKQGI